MSEEVPSCAVCYNAFQSASVCVIPCGHTFCDRCLPEQLKACPSCMKPFAPTDKQPNFQLREVLTHFGKAESEARATKRRLQESESRLVRMASQISAQKEEHDKALAQKTGEASRLSTEVRAERLKREELERDLGKRLRDREAESEALRAEVQRLRHQTKQDEAAYRKDVADSKEREARAQAAISRLRTQKQDAESNLTSVLSAVDENTRLRQQLEQKEHEIVSLKRKLAQYEERAVEESHVTRKRLMQMEAQSSNEQERLYKRVKMEQEKSVRMEAQLEMQRTQTRVAAFLCIIVYIATFLASGRKSSS